MILRLLFREFAAGDFESEMLSALHCGQGQVTPGDYSAQAHSSDLGKRSSLCQENPRQDWAGS